MLRLADETYEFIKAEVIDLFERYDVRCIPISGFELAMKMSITLVPYSSLEREKLFAAMTVSPDGFFLEPGNGNEYIYYNDFVGYRRSNMTILHEIGHDVLGHMDSMDPKEMEAEAAFFAKYAAAPPPLVHRIHPTCPEDIEDFFEISSLAACNAFRYYHKWCRQHERTGAYTHYESRLLDLFGFQSKEVAAMNPS